MIVRSRAPLRLSLGGGGTDVSPFCDRYGGYVLNATIDLYAHTHLEPIDGDIVRFSAADLDVETECHLAPALDTAGALPMHRAVYNRIVREFCGGRPFALQMVTH